MRPSTPATAAVRRSIADGHVVGINTFILAIGRQRRNRFRDSQQYREDCCNQLARKATCTAARSACRPDITPSLAAGLSLAHDYGVVLGDVDPDGPADQAGLKAGDIALSLNGKPMENARQFDVNLYGKALGEKVVIEVLRGEQKVKFNVEVIERDDDPLRFADMVNPEKNIIGRLGIFAIEINKQILQMLPDLRKSYGVVVAARAGGSIYSVELNPGDVIYALNGEPITTVAALRQALDKQKPTDPTVLRLSATTA